MSSNLDEAESLEGVEEPELVERAGRGKDVALRTAALLELFRRRAIPAVTLASKLVKDKRAPIDLRVAAARGLGTEASDSHEKALIAGLATDDPYVMSAAAKSLGRIGGVKAYEALKKLSAYPAAPWGQSVAFARLLITYRLGLGAERLSPPPEEAVLKLRRRRATELKFKEVGPKKVTRSLPELSRELPAIAVSTVGSVQLECRSQRQWVLLALELGEDARAKLAERQRVAAVVLKESSCPDGWYLTEYILTHPLSEGRAEVFGMRPSGRLLHYGQLDLAGGDPVLSLQSVDNPGVPALRLEAEYRGAEGKLVIKRASLATGAVPGQTPPAVPRPVGAPPGSINPGERHLVRRKGDAS